MFENVAVYTEIKVQKGNSLKDIDFAFYFLIES